MEDGMRAAFDAMADGDETITFEELCTFVAKKTSLQAGPKELRPSGRQKTGGGAYPRILSTSPRGAPNLTLRVIYAVSDAGWRVPSA